MPRGRYLLYDPHDGAPLGAEHFTCAPGPAGWRYTSVTTAPDGGAAGGVDLTLDAHGRPLRVEVRSGGWQVRGGAVDGVAWVRRPAPSHAAAGSPVAAAAQAGAGDPGGVREFHERAHCFAGRSPAFLVAAARLLRLRPGAGARLRVVSLVEPALAAHTADQEWSLEHVERHPTDSGPLDVSRYLVGDPATGERRTVHLAGDVVLAAPGVELEDLDSPPNQAAPPPAGGAGG